MTDQNSPSDNDRDDTRPAVRPLEPYPATPPGGRGVRRPGPALRGTIDRDARRDPRRLGRPAPRRGRGRDGRVARHRRPVPDRARHLTRRRPPAASAPSSGKVPRGPLSAFGLPFGGGPGVRWRASGSAASVSVASRSPPSTARTSRSRPMTAGPGRSRSPTDTKITKGGATITVGDLAVGDHVRIAQTRASDGTYTVTAIIVVLPSRGRPGRAPSTATPSRSPSPAARPRRSTSTATRPTRSTARRARCPTSRSARSSSPRARSGPTARSMRPSFAVASVAVAFQAARASVPGFPGGRHGARGRRRRSPAPSSSAS